MCYGKKMGLVCEETRSFGTLPANGVNQTRSDMEMVVSGKVYQIKDDIKGRRWRWWSGTKMVVPGELAAATARLI